MSRLKSRILLHAALPAIMAGTVGLSTTAYAQIEVVNVTAEKRVENVQNVPIAITAFTGADLAQKGAVSLNDLSNLTPNVTLDAGTPFSGDTSVLSASIRGVGSDDFAFNIDPAVGVYLDGIYLSRTIGANVDLLDVDRIEVAKGPQGTLFGRNTIGGAISIVTRDPGDTFMMKGQVTTGSLNRFDVGLTADIPISDDLRTSFTVSSVRRDGYQRVIPYDNVNHYTFDPPTTLNGGTDTHDAYGGQDRTAMRGKMVWTPNDHLTATWTGDWNHQDQEATPVTVMQTWPFTPNAGGAIAGLYTACVGGATGVIPGVIDWDTLCGLPRADGFPSHAGLPSLHSQPNLIPINPSTTQTGNIDTTYSNGPNFAKYDSEGTGITLAWTANDDLTLKSITGYRHITWNIGTDLDGAADFGEILNVTDKQRQQQFSQEFQAIGSSFQNKLNWVAGLYYFYEDGFVHDWVPFDGSLLAVDDSNLNDLKTTSYAGYVHADYKVTDKLGITLGARYSVEKKQFYGGQQDYNGLSYKASGCYPANGAVHTVLGVPLGVPMPDGNPVTATSTCQEFLGFPNAAHPYRYYPDGWNRQNFYLFTPTAGVQYHFTDDVMAYASWSKGFKSGGWTTRLSAPILDGSDGAYAPEKAKTTEVGLKSEWLDHRLLVNAAAFYTSFTEIQLNQQVGASPVLKNLGDADIKGFELETQAEVTDHFSLHANAGYIDAYYTSLDPSVIARDSAGNVIPEATITLQSKLPKTPKWKININPQYDLPFSGGSDLLLQASYTYVASLYNDSTNTFLLKQPPLNLLDLSARFSFRDGKYALTVGGTNVTDKRYINIGSTNYAAGFIDATYNAPAAWYATLDIKM